MGRNIIETVIGAVVLVVAASFIYIAYQSGSIKTVNGYVLHAKFDRVDGLNLGSDVRVSGLKVGTIVKQEIDPETYLANVSFSVDRKVLLPKDSSAEIVSDGLLGGKYLALVPGGEEAMLKEGDEVTFTQSSVSIEQLIGKFVFGSADKEKEEDEGASSSDAVDNTQAPNAPREQ